MVAGTLQDDMNTAQQYTHWWNFAIVLMLIVMCVNVGIRFKQKAESLGVLITLTVLVIVSTGLSMAAHSDTEYEKRTNDKALSIVEQVFVCLTLAMAVLSFLIIWTFLGWAKPFEQSSAFGFLLFGIIISAAKMGALFFYSSGYKQKHKENGEPFVSPEYDRWSFYHLQWHLVSGFCGFLITIGLYLMLKMLYQ
jgi:hypothetical protein